MSQQSIFLAIEGYLQTNLASIPAAVLANVAFLGKTYVPEAETPYIDVSMPVMAGHMLSTGTAGVYEWRGVLQVTPYWPIGGGLQEATNQADAIRSIFVRGLGIPTTDGYTVRFFSPTVKPLLQDGAWISAPVQCPWFLHEVTA